MTVMAADGAPQVFCAQVEGRKVLRWWGTWCFHSVRGMWCVQEWGGLNQVAGLVGTDWGCKHGVQ